MRPSITSPWFRDASDSPRVDQNLYCWLSGSCAALGAATSASANVVQITHADLITTTNTGEERNTIDGDFTADGVIDMTNVMGNYFPAQEYVNLFINSVKVASAGSTTDRLFASVNGVENSTSKGPDNPWYVSQSGLVPITFRDGRINGGALTSAMIEVRSVGAIAAAKIQVLRTVFDDESTAPPAGVAVGGANPEFVPGRAEAEAAQRIAYSNKIAKVKKKIKKTKKSGKEKKAKKLKKQLKKLTNRLKNL